MSTAQQGTGSIRPEPPASSDELQLVEALRGGDEAAFVTLIDRYQGPLVRLAQVYVGDRAVAEEVVQETWLGVLRGLDRFEGRSSLKTWIFRILTNRAKTRGEREGRTVPFSALSLELDPSEPSVGPERFLPPDHPRWPGHWSSPLKSWGDDPVARLLSGETLGYVETALNALPQSQRTVIALRDVEGWASDEVCSLLGISETNQRVLLHRARSKVRMALEQHLSEGESSKP